MTIGCQTPMLTKLAPSFMGASQKPSTGSSLLQLFARSHFFLFVLLLHSKR